MAKHKAPSRVEKIAYSTDASMIEGQAIKVFFPKNSQEVSEIVRSSHGVTPRGAGTGLAGGAVPSSCSVIDLSKMNRVLEFDRKKQEIEVEAGIILDELNEHVEKFGLEFPVKPSSHEVCTIGGMIATNAVGSRAMKYGRTSEWVEWIEVVNGKGEIFRVSKANISDFSGMEGITGIVTRAKLKLCAKRARTAELIAFQSLEEVQEKAVGLKMNRNVCALEFYDRLASGIMQLPDSYHLLVEYESDEGKLKGTEYQKILDMRDSAYPKLANAGFTRIEDPKVMVSKFAEFAKFLELLKVPFFGHLGSGIIHPCFQARDNKKIDEAIKMALKLHGQVSGEHGIGLVKKKFLDENDKKLIARVKQRHDPLGKLNCGKIIDFEPEQEPNGLFEGKESKHVNSVDIVNATNSENINVTHNFDIEKEVVNNDSNGENNHVDNINNLDQEILENGTDNVNNLNQEVEIEGNTNNVDNTHKNNSSGDENGS